MPLRTTARMRRTARDDGRSGPGPVTTGLERPRLRDTGGGPALGVRRNGIVLWLDLAGHYTGFVDRLRRCATPARCRTRSARSGAATSR